MKESRRRVSDHVTTLLRSWIYSGEYKPGQRLPELDLSARLGVSRSPLREALLRLQREGLVELHPRRGASVASFSKEDVQEIAELRSVLEGLAARLAATRGSEEELGKLRAALEEMRQAADRGDSVAAAVAHIAFHRSIGRASGMARLVGFLDQLAAQSVALQGYAELPGEELAELAASHGALIEAIASGDGDVAESAVVAHIKGFSDPIKRYLERARDGTEPERRRRTRRRA
jgi:DNA-binding GntR family transcriptional regulator